MPGAALSAGASIVGGLMGSDAAESAADTQAAAADRASQVQWDMFQQNREDLAPWRQAGGAAVNRLAQLLGIGGNAAASDYGNLLRSFTMADYEADPGYQFRLDEGRRGLEMSAAARGGLLSGRALKDLTAYGQGMASQEYQGAYNRFNNDQSTIFNRLSALAGTGQQAGNTLAQLGQNTANQVGSNIIGAGNAAAAGQVGSANAINNAIGQGMSFYQSNRLLGLLGGGGGGQGYSSFVGNAYQNGFGPAFTQSGIYG
ncbi:hypothetical protein N5K27_22420 [Pigmentiphaga sp. GD03639]|uniref:hypothetical protein n=1 Tax=Pigmentiphaga sp. GD03639 TaxID=2975354 RepID=UPI00244C9CBE|nr:hypothetical protein [Pigmentiphaga sp. GD03639]MDH2239067.1 hypothetical protein [Pigmentiphaga sp. GD03639]